MRRLTPILLIGAAALCLVLGGCGESSGTLNQAAIDSLEKGDMRGAEQGLMRALSKDPVNKTLLTNLVEVYFREKKWDEAVQLLKKGLSIEGLSSDNNLKVLLAEAYVMKGENGPAFNLLKDLAEKDAKNEYLLFLQGLACNAPKQAIEILKRAIEINPGRKESYLALARALAWSGETEKARATLAELSKKAGPTREVLLYQIALYLRDSDIQMARTTLSEAPADLRDDPMAKLYEAYLDLADRKVPEARAAFESLEDAAPVSNRAKLGTALCLLMEDDPNAAIENCQEVLDTNPKETVALNLKGLGQLKRLQKFLAKKTFESSLEINADQPGIKALVDRLGSR
jgi:predicted Zn-dependent protease